MKRRFSELMRCEDNKVFSGTLAGQALVLGISPRLYRFTVVLTLFFCVFLTHWSVLIPVSLYYLVLSYYTPKYDSMYDSTSEHYDPTLTSY